MILFGLMARWGALLLVVFTAGTIFFVHNFWDMTSDAYEQNMILALKNLSIMGGLLLVVAVGSAPARIRSIDASLMPDRREWRDTDPAILMRL